MQARSCLALLTLAALSAAPASAAASERQFTYTHNTATLAPGQTEIEPWTTFRVGRDNFYFRMQNRLELEAGLTDWLQGAFYLNTSTTTKDVTPEEGGPDVRETEFEFEGVSLELKAKLSDAVADALGFGLYLEPSIGPAEGEVEVKVLLDKRAGDFYFAYNLVGEYEIKYGEADEVEHELVLEHDLGLAGYLRSDVTLGVEIRNASVWVVDEGFEGSAFFAGPAVGFRQKGFWASASFMPQLFAIKPEGAAEGVLDLEHNERINSRLLLGFDL